MSKELKITDAQWKAIRILSRSQYASRKIGGHGMAPVISAIKALVRKGLAFQSSMFNSYYGLTDEGKALVDEAMKRMPPKVQP